MKREDYIRRQAEFIHKGSVYPQLVKVEYDKADESLPEAERIAVRLRKYILAQPVYIDDGNLFTGHLTFDGSVPSDLFPRIGHANFWAVASKYYCKPQENLVTFEWQHSTPNYADVIENGLAGMKARIRASLEKNAADSEKVSFLRALLETCDTLIAWANKCADALEVAAASATPGRAAELRESAAILRKVPEQPASTFREAVQSLYICFDMLSDSIGTIDRYLRKTYEADLAAGRVSRDEAKHFIQELFLRIQSHTPPSSVNHNRGGECHFAIGGYLPDGTDGFNDLSHLIVEALMELPTNIPEISLRWTKHTPFETLRWMLDCERRDPYKRFAFVNDEPRIEGFMKNIGLSYADACSYTMVGCNEPAFPGTVWFGGCTVNLARSLENTLYRHADEAVACGDFDAFFALYRRELAGDLDKIFEYANFFNAERAKDLNVLSSLFLDGCIESGKSATQGGCRIGIGGSNLMGLVCVADSLSVIKQFVYDEKTVTMARLIEVLRSDWEADPALRGRILKTGKFHGNADDDADGVMRRLTDTLAELVRNRRLGFGQRIVFGTLAGYHPHYMWFGAMTEATPDGRRRGEGFLVGSGQASGRDREGLAALLTSVARMQPSGILTGPFVCNVLLDEKLVRDDAFFERTCRIIETYFKMGGLHIQLNYVSKEDLLKARQTPEPYREMKVRVSGYSDYFVNLRNDQQDEIIARTSVGS